MMRLLLFLVAVCSSLGDAPPYLTFMSTYMGPDIGGFSLVIFGRNLGFLDNDVQVFIAGMLVDGVTVGEGWETLHLIAPPCALCGAVPVVVVVGKRRSNELQLLYTSMLIIVYG